MNERAKIAVTVENLDPQQWPQEHGSKLITANELAMAMRAVAKLARELQDRIATLETNSEVKEVDRDAQGRAARLTTGTSNAKSLRRQIVALEAKLAAMEQQQLKSPPIYAGTWKAGAQYEAGVFATFEGTLWFCHATTADKPGTSKNWQLAVKTPRK